MHPMMIMALAGEVERERQRDRHTAQLRSLALANHAQGFDGSHAARGSRGVYSPVFACGPGFPDGWPATRYREREDLR